VNELPNGWATVVLKELGSWGSGGTPKRTDSRFYSNGTIPWLVIGDLNDGVVTHAQTYITEEGLLNSSAKLLPPNTLLVAMYGSISKLSITGIECATNQAIAFCTPDQEIIELRYLFYALKHSKNELIAQGQGVAQKNISQTILKAHQIPVAPRREQNRIADKLDSLLARVNACSDRLDRVRLILKHLRQAALNLAISGHLTEDGWFSDKFYADRDTPKLPLSRLLSEPLQNGRSVRDGDGAWVLRLTSIRGGKIDIQEKKQGLWSRDEAARFFVQEGDFLVARGNGSLHLVGRGGLVDNVTEEVAYPDTMIRIRPNTALITLEFLELVWNSDSIRGQIEQRAKTTSGLWKISQSDLEEIIVDVPTIEEQSEVILRVRALLTYVDNIEVHYQNACARIEELTPVLLTKAFHGDLVPQDLNDEPASVLLERIRVAKAAHETKKVATVRKSTMAKLSQESVKEVIRQLPRDKFWFEDLREKLPSDYDLLKEILFTLLDESEPSITQIFDQEAQTMCFIREQK